MKNFNYNFLSVRNEKGSVLLTTLLVMFLLTIIVLGSFSTSSIDLQISRNYKVYKENLILADAAVNEAKSLVLNGIADNSASWVNGVLDLYNEDDKYLKQGTSYDTSNTPVLNEIDVDEVIDDWNAGKAVLNPRNLSADPGAQYVVYRNLNSPDNEFVVLVRSEKNGGEVVIEAGFSN
ncbi:MAG: pilus assembly PilX family protein [Candidatus Muiribacteriota bacterium]